jgi:hypothetical protein
LTVDDGRYACGEKETPGAKVEETVMNTLDGVYILIKKGKPVFWKQKGPNGKDVSGLVIALTHQDAKKWSDWFYERHNQRISPYLMGSSSENFNISLAEFSAHDLGERLDVVFVLNYEEDKPRFWFVPPEQLPEILDN